MTDRMWEVTTTHAKTCVPGDKVYAYSAAHGTVYVDSVFNLVKVEIGGVECPLPQLDGIQSVSLRLFACRESAGSLLNIAGRFFWR
jgi:hypothetical protein